MQKKRPSLPSCKSSEDTNDGFESVNIGDPSDDLQLDFDAGGDGSGEYKWSKKRNCPSLTLMLEGQQSIEQRHLGQGYELLHCVDE